MSSVLSFLPAAVWRWAALVGAGVATLLTIMNLRARLSSARAGKREAERKIKVMREAQEIENDVETMDRSAVDSGLSRWMRPGD